MTTSPAASAVTMVFPDAPAGAAAPESSGALFKARMKAFRAAHRPWVIAWMVLIIALPVTGILLIQYPFAGISFLVLAAIAIIVLVVQHGKAANEFFNAYAAARGLSHVEDGGHLSADVPLLHKGDKREVHRVLSGTVGPMPAQVAQFTYTDVSTDSEGRRSETDYDYTLVCFHLPEAVAQRYAGVFVRDKGWLSMGGAFDGVSADREVTLESAEFEDKYRLRVRDEQDDVALYELFSTTFIHDLATQFDCAWEQVGSSLVVTRKGHCSDTSTLDGLCTSAVRVLTRYLDEHQ